MMMLRIAIMMIVIISACLMARVCAMKLRAVLLEITCGPSESIHSRAEAEDLVHKLVKKIIIIMIVIHLIASYSTFLGITSDITA